MPSLKLSNPFRRGVDRPSLKQRAASLKATAARVMTRKAPDQDADPFEGTHCPDGFVPYPFNKPMSYSSIQGVVIPAEARRLLDLALDEYQRCCGSFPDHVSEKDREAVRQAKRAALRLDALAAVAAPVVRGVRPAPVNAEADALLLDLGRQFEAARLAEEAADREYSTADEKADAVRPLKPASLRFRASDRDFGLRESGMHPDAWEGLEVFHDDIAWMRSRTFTREVWRKAREGERAWHGQNGDLPEIQPYPEAQARAAELVGIWDAWQAECDRTEAEAGVPAACDASMAAYHEAKGIAAQIASIPAHTAEGLKVKIRVLDFYAYSSAKDEPDAVLMRSLARDAALAVSDVQLQADPVFAVLDRYKAARGAWDAFSDHIKAVGWEALGGIEAGSEEDSRLGRIWSDLATEVLGTAPVTDAGRLAFADFVETWVADHGNADGSPQDGSETVFAEVYPALLRAVRLSAEQIASPAAKAAPPIARDFLDSLDLSAIQMRDLAAIYDAAGLIGGVADAVSCQPRSYTSDEKAWNTIGLFADAISEACGAVQADAVREARKRTPSDDWEQGLRLKILAQDTIENGDKGAMLAFARDLQVMG